MLTIARWLTAACGLSLALGGRMAAQSPVERRAPAPSVIAVPFLSQSELLCGGAALAMVERYFGARGIFAEQFASLVRPADHGIRTTDLAQAAEAGGWVTRAFDGTPDQVRQSLRDSIPVIVLIAVGPNRYHYVVLLGWDNGRVRYHDPAIGPSRSAAEAGFLRAWQGGQNWAMTIGPGQPTSTPDARPSPPPLPATDPLPCSPYLDHAITAASRGEVVEAAALLAEGRTRCPDVALILREQAGVQFKLRHFEAADSLAEAFLSRAPGDTLGWQILASSRYLAGDRSGALDAWNFIGRPRVDLVRIDGVRRIHFSVIESAIGIHHGTMLTTSALTHARRRALDIPALNGGAVGYQPVGGGLSEVHAAVVERPVLPPWWTFAAANGISALGQSQVGVSVASPTGLGERWTGSWRWARAHPLVDFTVDLPVHLGMTGVIGFEGGWQRWRYATGIPSEETRRAGSLTFGGWITSALRPSAGFRLEHWSAGRQYLVPSAGLEFRAANDRLSIRGRAEQGAALNAESSYTVATVRIDWASSFGLRRTSWSARLGADAASRATPLGVQPSASNDVPFAIPLRAHPWTRNGLLPANTIGRTILHGGMSGDQPVLRTGLFTVAAGIFMDGAEVRNAADGSNRDRFYLDAGAGLRIGILDGEFGVIRVDLATGLTDHTTALTVGLHQEWPTFRARSY